jgi:hypothetical protein
MTPCHFAPLPADLSIEHVRERYDHPDMPEKMEMIHGTLFWDDTQRFHVLGMLIESLDTETVENFISHHRAA